MCVQRWTAIQVDLLIHIQATSAQVTTAAAGEHLHCELLLITLKCNMCEHKHMLTHTDIRIRKHNAKEDERNGSRITRFICRRFSG